MTCALHWWNPAAQTPPEGCECPDIRIGKVITINAPAELPTWKHWFYVAMERIFGWEYPTEEIFFGYIESVK